MGIETEGRLREQLVFGSIVLMLIGLMISRALLSTGLIAFLLFTCIHRGFLTQLRSFFKQPLLVGISLLFLLPFITGLWSRDLHEWARWNRVKLPLLLLPLAFAGMWQLRIQQWRVLAWLFILVVCGGTGWSLWHYLADVRGINASYLKAKSLPTPLGNDHIRFSLLVCLAIIAAAILAVRSTLFRIRLLLALTAMLLAIYLHVLSARTGLIGLYIFLASALVHLLLKGAGKRLLPVVLVLLALPLAAWLLLPTFRNRIQYIVYDFSYIEQGRYLPGANDGNRMLSLKAGRDILLRHPFGVGSGDVKAETYEWYDDHVPGMLPTDRFYPSSEWLMYGAAAGWFGFILVTVCMLLPAFEKMGQERFFWLSLNSIAAFSLVFDIGLEVQYGVFIYAFFILWWRKWLRCEANSKVTNEFPVFDSHHLQERS